MYVVRSSASQYMLGLRIINRQGLMATLLRQLTLCLPPPSSCYTQYSSLHMPPCHAHLTTRVYSSSSSSSSSSSYQEDIHKASSQGAEARIEGPVFSHQTDEDDEEWYRARAEDEEWFRREESFYESYISETDRHPEQINHNCDYLSLSDSALFAQCRMDTFRASGPGGQHRNKTDSGVRLTHLPTAVVAQAVEDRSQHKNRAIAMNRLRFLIAAKVRRPLKLREYQPPPELVRLLPAETSKKHIGDKIGINHPDYPKGVQALLDLLAASQGYVSYAATVLRVNPAALSKILTSDKTLLQATNELLISKGQKPFK